jgi:peroxiredoxin
MRQSALIVKGPDPGKGRGKPGSVFFRDRRRWLVNLSLMNLRGWASLLLVLVVTAGPAYGQFSHLKNGSPAPDFDVRSLDALPLKLSELAGKVVILNFWFIACPPCRFELPGLNRVVTEFEGREVVFVAFSLDSETELKPFLEEHPFKYQVVPDATPIARKYGIGGAPVHVIIDPGGRVDSIFYGPLSDPNDLGVHIRRLLAVKNSSVF